MCEHKEQDSKKNLLLVFWNEIVEQCDDSTSIDIITNVLENSVMENNDVLPLLYAALDKSEGDFTSLENFFNFFENVLDTLFNKLGSISGEQQKTLLDKLISLLASLAPDSDYERVLLEKIGDHFDQDTLYQLIGIITDPNNTEVADWDDSDKISMIHKLIRC